MCGLAMAKSPQYAPDSHKIKCVFLSLHVSFVLRHFLAHCICAWHVPAYAKAQCCFKSFALRSCQCGRTRVLVTRFTERSSSFFWAESQHSQQATLLSYNASAEGYLQMCS